MPSLPLKNPSRKNFEIFGQLKVINGGLLDQFAPNFDEIDESAFGILKADLRVILGPTRFALNGEFEDRFSHCAESLARFVQRQILRRGPDLAGPAAS